MLSKLARQLGIVLLAVSLMTSPVLGAMPRCCQTGAIAGSGDCCCGPREEASELPSCCQHAQRSCCAEAAAAVTEQPASEDSPVAESAPCNCKTIGQMPALDTAKDRIETHEKQLNVVAVFTLGDATSRFSMSHIGEHQEAEPPGLPLYKVHCRWTI